MKLRLLRLQVIKTTLEYELDLIKQDNKEIANYISEADIQITDAENKLRGS